MTVMQNPDKVIGDAISVVNQLPARLKDVQGKQKISMSQNIYEADFEYGLQPLRWESFTAGGSTITHDAALGGVKMTLPTTSGAITIRQSRPYHRYQPGKAMFMASAVNFGITQANQEQRVGYFDDSNGPFYLQSGAPTATNPFGIYFGYRSDSSGVVVDVLTGIDQGTGSRDIVGILDWRLIEMIYIEYAWYGAGGIRWGVVLDGEPYILHQIGFGNKAGQTVPWARTGNLPVRYEQRNTGTTALANDMYHWGVSVMVEGGIDNQRGFTYGYGMAPTALTRNVASNTARYPVLSVRGRIMGKQEYTQATAAATAGTTTSLTAATATWTVNQWKGRMLNYYVSNVSYTARITSNTATVLTLADIVTGGALGTAPVAAGNYTIGLINRGQLLPDRLLVSSDARCLVEVIVSTPGNPVVLTGASFVALSTLGSAQSFAERDVSATALTGGEVVYAFTSPAGGSGLQDLNMSNLFPLYNTLRGDATDILTVAVTTTGTTANVGAHFVCQEAMS